MNELANLDNHDFDEIISIIERARENAFRAANRELIAMYWEIGKYVSDKIKNSGWGKSVVKGFAAFIQSRFLGIRGFSPQNIWRMKQFYETYCHNEKLSTLSREISWSNNVLIMMSAKSDEAREFYLFQTHKNNYSARELERQIESRLFERAMISDIKNEQYMARSPGLAALRDSYVLEFLDVPENHREVELRKAIIANLRDFILEFGKDFSFVGDEYRIQVGNTDFRIDLLLFNRELSCLVAIELKVKKFKPEYLGQLEAGKDDAVVEYALSRSLSPALIADYQLHLPNKVLLENKLRELTEYVESAENSGDDE